MRALNCSRTYRMLQGTMLIVYKLKSEDCYRGISMDQSDMESLFNAMDKLKLVKHDLEYLKIRTVTVSLPVGKKLIRDNDGAVLIDNSW